MLDDYIQHHNYAFLTQFQWKKTWQMLNDMGLLSFRPLAGIMDLSLWSLLYPQMILGVALITLLYACSAWLFYRLFQEFYPCSPLFLVLYCLFPLGFEGTYWMSASTRIIPSLYFTALTASYFHRFCITGKWKQCVLFFLFQCLSYCFYEQGMVLSITFVGLLSLYHFCYREASPVFPQKKYRPHWKRSLCGLSFLISLGLYYFVTNTAYSSNMVSKRTEFIFPSPYYYEVFLPDLLGQLQVSFVEGSFGTFFLGLSRGWRILWEHWGIWYLCLATLLPCFLFFFPKETQSEGEARQKSSKFSKFLKFSNSNTSKIIPKEKKTSSVQTARSPQKENALKKGKPLTFFRVVMGLFLAFLLAFAPISIFFVIANPWFSLRGTVTSFCGLALAMDLLLVYVSGLCPKGFYVQRGFAIILASLCLVASVSELSDYKDTYEDDIQVVSTLYPYVKDFTAGQKIALLGVEPSYLEEMNVNHHEHLHGVTQSDWALSGCFTAYAKWKSPSFVPLPMDRQCYYPYEGGSKRPDAGGFDVFFHYDHDTGTVTPLTYETIHPEEEYHFFDPEGNLFAVLLDVENHGFLSYS